MAPRAQRRLRALHSHLAALQPSASATQQLLGPRGFGVELTGIDLSCRVSEADMAAIVDAFEEHSLVLFRNANITMEQQVAFSHQFAEATDAIMEMGYGNEWEDGGIRHSADAHATSPTEAAQLAHAEDPRERAWEEGRTRPGAFVSERRDIADKYRAYESQRSKQNGPAAARASPAAESSVRGWQEMATSPRNM